MILPIAVKIVFATRRARTGEILRRVQEVGSQESAGA